MWTGEINRAKAVIRLPSVDLWNGKLLISGTASVRSEFAMDHILSDIAVQRGYAYAACDKATPGLILRDPTRSMLEWQSAYEALTEKTRQFVIDIYGTTPSRTYIAGASNGGYVTRVMMENYDYLFDGGIEWEGVLWHTEKRHLLTTLPVYISEYPIYKNWRGNRTKAEQKNAYEKILEAGLPAESEPFWDTYYRRYWVVTLWLYGRNIDPDWGPFKKDWSNEWLTDPSPIAHYPWHERTDILKRAIIPIANSGKLTKPLLSVAGNLDCLVSFRHHALAYKEVVESSGSSAWHRLYEIAGGNHVDGLLSIDKREQQPVQPYFEAALYHLEEWVEKGKQPPDSGCYSKVKDFAHDYEPLSFYSE